MGHKHIFAPLAWVAVLGLVMGLEGLSARSDLTAGFTRIFDGAAAGQHMDAAGCRPRGAR